MSRTTVLSMWQRLALLVIAPLAMALLAVVVIDAQNATDHERVRVRARALADGRVEFTLRTPSGILEPRARFFPADDGPTGWTYSSKLTLSNGAKLQIAARRLDDGRVEFGVRPEGDRRPTLPRQRYFPTDATVGSWLVSTPVTVSAPQPEPMPEAEQAEQPEQDDQPDQSDQSSQSDQPEDSSGATSPPDTDDGGSDADESSVERISGGHRDGLIVDRNVIGNPDAPVLIAEYGDPY